MNEHDTIAYQNRLATYRDNLRHLLVCLKATPEQETLLRAIEEARRSIAEHKQILRERGVMVDDLPEELDTALPNTPANPSVSPKDQADQIYPPDHLPPPMIPPPTLNNYQQTHGAQGTFLGSVNIHLAPLTPETETPDRIREIRAYLQQANLFFHADDDPYRGLLTFQPEHADRFFGRDRLVVSLIKRHLSYRSFLAVLGASGSGKSSLVRAGVLPMLMSGALNGSKHWRYLTMKPGPNPLDTLARELAVFQGGGVDAMRSLQEDLARDDLALLFIARQVAQREGQRLVLFVDQFEELWTLQPTDPIKRADWQEQQQRQFIRLLLSAAVEPGGPLVVIVTLRADFLHRAAEEPGLAPVLADNDAIVSSMSQEELRQAILYPARQAGGDFEAGLVERLIEEVYGQVGTLPLLEYTLLRLWKQRRPDGTMTWDAYHKLKGVEGALAEQANELVQTHYASPEKRDALRYLLLRLVQPGEGVLDTRRRVRLVDLIADGQTLDEVRILLQPLIDERLLTSGLDAGVEQLLSTTNLEKLGQEATVEISHEALIRGWPLLNGWIDEAREDLRVQLQLEEASREWERQSESVDLLWSRLRLEDVEERIKQGRIQPSARDRRFLDASHAEEQRRAEEQRIAEENRRRLAEEQRNASRLRRFLGVAGTLLVVALVAAGFAVASQRAAEQAQARADEANLRAQLLARAGEALSVVQQNPERAMVLALASLPKSQPESAEPLQRRALSSAFDDIRLTWILKGHTATVIKAEWTSDARGVFTVSEDGSAKSWDANTGFLKHTFSNENCPVIDGSLSPSGKIVLTVSLKSICFWDFSSGELIKNLSSNDDVIAVNWYKNNESVAIFQRDGLILFLDIQSGSITKDIQIQSESRVFLVRSILVSPNGRYVAIIRDIGPVYIWDLDNGKKIRNIDVESFSTNVMTWSHDSKRIITGSNDGLTYIWNVENGKSIQLSNGATPFVSSISIASWSPDDQRIATGNSDGSIRIWDANTGDFIRGLTGHTGLIVSIDWSPLTSAILTAGSDNSARIWFVDEGILFYTLPGHIGGLTVAKWNSEGNILTAGGWNARIWYSGWKSLHMFYESGSGMVLKSKWDNSGKYILFGTYNGYINNWNAETGDKIIDIKNTGIPVRSIDWSPDGRFFAAIGQENNIVNIWNMSEKKTIRRFKHNGDVVNLSWSHNGKYIACSADKGIYIWDAQSGDLVHKFADNGLLSAPSIEWSPDDKLIMSSAGDLGNNFIHIWNVETGVFMYGDQGMSTMVTTVSWRPDGSSFLAAFDDGTIHISESKTGQQIRLLRGHSGEIHAAAWSADGKYILTGGSDATARIWDSASGDVIRVFQGHSLNVAAVSWSPDGKTILTGSYDNTARVWDVATGQTLQILQVYFGAVVKASWNPNGKTLLTAGLGGQVHVWLTDPQLMAAALTRRICNVYQRDDAAIRAEVPGWEWRGCDAELAAVADDLKEYDRLRGQ
ncbi:MAG: hypothetical protein OHK0022_45930 [Roseiflexaceae bacterium]